jgi:hypothetical protein
MCLCWWGRGVTLPIGGVERKEGINTLVGIDGVQCEIDIGDGMDAGIMRLGGRCTVCYGYGCSDGGKNVQLL